MAIDDKNKPAVPVVPVKPVHPMVAAAINEGRVVFVGEFRRGLAVEFSGKGNRLFHQSKCTVETDTGTITVTEFLPDEVKWQEWKAPFEKGQMVMCICRGLEESSGVLVANGKMHLLT